MVPAWIDHEDHEVLTGGQETLKALFLMLSRTLLFACSLLSVLASTVDSSDYCVFSSDTSTAIYKDLSVADLARTYLVSKQWHENTLVELQLDIALGRTCL